MSDQASLIERFTPTGLATAGTNPEYISVDIPTVLLPAADALGLAARLLANPHAQQYGVSIDAVGDRHYVCVRCLLAADQTMEQLRRSVWGHAHGLGLTKSQGSNGHQMTDPTGDD